MDYITELIHEAADRNISHSRSLEIRAMLKESRKGHRIGVERKAKKVFIQADIIKHYNDPWYLFQTKNNY